MKWLRSWSRDSGEACAQKAEGAAVEVYEQRAEDAAEKPAPAGINAEDALLSAILGDGGMTREKIMEIPTVSACVSKLAGTVASLPIKLYHIGGDGEPEEVAQDERLRLLNLDTGDTLNAYEFWLNMVEDYYIGRGAYAFIRKEAGHWRGLHHVQEHKIAVLKNEDPIFKRYLLQINGASYLPHEFLKIRRRAKDGISGKALHEEKPLIFAVAYATMLFERSNVQKGGNKRGFIETEKRLSEGAMKAIKEAWMNLYSTDSDRVVVLNDGAKFKESSNTSVEMQLYENKKSNNNEICKTFGFPVTILDGGASAADLSEYLKTVTTLLNAIEAALDADLLLESEKGSFYFAFDTRELTRGNVKERYEAYKIGLESNFLQIDEVREKEDLPPLGFKWIRVGLKDVLLDVENGTVFTPNMNATTKLGKLEDTQEGDEENEN